MLWLNTGEAHDGALTFSAAAEFRDLGGDQPTTPEHEPSALELSLRQVGEEHPGFEFRAIELGERDLNDASNAVYEMSPRMLNAEQERRQFVTAVERAVETSSNYVLDPDGALGYKDVEDNEGGHVRYDFYVPLTQKPKERPDMTENSSAA